MSEPITNSHTFSIQLTFEQQSELQKYLPRNYSFHPYVRQSKRPKAVKKLDQGFTNQYSIAHPQKKQQKHSTHQKIQEKHSTHQKIQEKHSTHQKISTEFIHQQHPKEINLKNIYSQTNIKPCQPDRVIPLEIFSDPDIKISQKQKMIPEISQLEKIQKSKKIEAGKMIGSRTSMKDGEASLKTIDTLSCLKILQRLKLHKSSWPFRLPVDPIAQGVPDYFEIILQPIDLRSIERKLKQNTYNLDSEFHQDLLKIFSNSYKFNPEESVFYAHTKEFQAYYQKILQEFNQNPKNFTVREKTRSSTNIQVDQAFSHNDSSETKKNDLVKQKRLEKQKNIKAPIKEEEIKLKLDKTQRQQQKTHKFESIKQNTLQKQNTLEKQKLSEKIIKNQSSVSKEEKIIQKIETPSKRQAQKPLLRMLDNKKSEEAKISQNNSLIPLFKKKLFKMPVMERQKLYSRISNFSQDQFLQLMTLFSENMNENEFEIDVEELSDEKLNILKKFVFQDTVMKE